jgi:hypothetical protein
MADDDEQNQDAFGCDQRYGPQGSIVAIIDNRAREVGFAAFQAGHGKLVLAQYVEPGRSTAATTLLMLSLYDACEVVVLQGRDGAAAGSSDLNSTAVTTLMKSLLPHLPGTKHTAPRSAFDDSRGRELVESYASAESWARACRCLGASGFPDGLAGASGDVTRGMYLAFGAAGALLSHLLQVAAVPNLPSVRAPCSYCARCCSVNFGDTV